MAHELLKLIDTRIKAGQSRALRILRIAEIIEIKTDDSGIKLGLSLHEIGTLEDVPLVSLNGLQKFPEKGNTALIFCPEGYLEHAIALGIIDPRPIADESSTVLKSGESTVVIKPEAIKAQSGSNLGELLNEAMDRVSELVTGGLFVPASTAGSKAPIFLAKIELLKTRLKRFS